MERASAGAAGRPVRVLFVCLGNICRSPMAEAVFRDTVRRRGLADRFEIDSCGTAGYHIGDPPDDRTVRVCRQHDVAINHVGRKLARDDLTRFDYVLGMDNANLDDIKRQAPAAGATARVALFGSYDAQGERIIEDPYYGSLRDFEKVYEQCVRSSEGLLRALGF